MAHREHPSLIDEGNRRTNPSKCIQGDDYPITPLEELRVHSKGMYVLTKVTIILEIIF